MIKAKKDPVTYCAGEKYLSRGGVGELYTAVEMLHDVTSC
jgi:hypothetical protein